MTTVQRSRHKFGRKLMCRPRYCEAATAYFNEAGVVDHDAKVAVSSFIQELRELGLWDSCILGMTLRAKQNAGTGTRAYAFKGGYGSLWGGPVWSEDGVVFDSISKSITLSDKAALTNTVRSGMCVFYAEQAPSLCNFLVSVEASTAQTVHFCLRLYSGIAGYPGPGVYMTRGGAGSLNLTPGRSVFLDSWQVMSASMDDTSDQLYQNMAIVPGGSRTGLAAINPTGIPTNSSIGGGFGTGDSLQTIAAVLLFGVTMSAAEMGKLYEHVKTYLCPDLNLP